MALSPFSSEQYRKRTARGGTTGDECCLCGKDTSGQDGAIHVPVNHERGEFVTEDQIAVLGDAVSYFPIGPECARKWSREFKCHSVRFRQTKGGLVCYDAQARR